MKNKSQIVILAAFIGGIMLTACAGHSGRQNARVDRRQDAAVRTETRVDNRQGNRYDRRGDRQERVDARYQ